MPKRLQTCSQNPNTTNRKTSKKTKDKIRRDHTWPTTAYCISCTTLVQCCTTLMKTGPSGAEEPLSDRRHQQVIIIVIKPKGESSLPEALVGQRQLTSYEVGPLVHWWWAMGTMTIAGKDRSSRVKSAHRGNRSRYYLSLE